MFLSEKQRLWVSEESRSARHKSSFGGVYLVKWCSHAFAVFSCGNIT